MVPTLFRGAGAAGHVFFFKKGSVRNKGLAWSGLLGPKVVVAVVPTTTQILDFAVSARTHDQQIITICGNVKVAFVPDVAVRKFDFTVDRESGSYLAQWQQMLRSMVVEQVLEPVRKEAHMRDVVAATTAYEEIRAAVEAAIAAQGSPLLQKGVTVESCSVTKIEATDNEIEHAIGAKERQEMLSGADKAMHDRRIQAAENERAVQQYEAATALLLEEERSKLIETQGTNKVQEADDDAKASRMRFESFGTISAEKLLGMALLEMGKTGVSQLSIVPELFAALREHRNA
jgi:hypothetical protein